MSVSGARPVALVAGMVAGVPGQGGASWAVLQYVLGLRDLGYDSWLVECIPDETPSPAVRRYFEGIRRRFGLDGRAAIIDARGEPHGLSRTALRAAADRAVVLLDLAGTLRDPELRASVPVRVYVDLDPGFTQLWQAGGIDMRFDGHTHFATVGRDLGRPGCRIPALGIDWIPLSPPVALSAWPPRTEGPRYGWTTLANWRGYGSIEHDGRTYGQKAHAFRALLDLPARSGARFDVALAIHPDETRDLAALETNGWRLLAPESVAGTPDAYAGFIAASFAEIGIAKSGYVAADCGWFSDRSACYLASGRPVVAQATGFERHLPTGRGLLAFSDAEEAVAAIEAVRADPAAHARAAREIAEAHLAAPRVLGGLLAEVGVA